MQADFAGGLLRLDTSSHQHQGRLVVVGIADLRADFRGTACFGAQEIELDGIRRGGVCGEEGFKQPFEDITAIAQAPFLFELIDLGEAFERELQGEPPFGPCFWLSHGDSRVRGTCPPGAIKAATGDGAGGDHPATSIGINHAGSR
jgi:hypothetical protein